MSWFRNEDDGTVQREQKILVYQAATGSFACGLSRHPTLWRGRRPHNEYAVGTVSSAASWPCEHWRSRPRSPLPERSASPGIPSMLRTMHAQWGGYSDDLRPRKATLSLFVDEHLSCSANVEDARIGAVPSILSVTRGLSARALLRELGDLVHIVLCDEVRPSQQRTAASDFIAVSFIEPEQID
jgi:hypothetical protein